MSRRQQKADRDGKRFVAVPIAVIESPAYRAASGNAVKLLLELAAQFKGRNNGDLAMPWRLAHASGWASKKTLHAAKRDLLAKGLIVETRRGSRPRKASLYALTWLGLDECGKLDMSPAAFAKVRGAYAQFDGHGRNFGAPLSGPKRARKEAIRDATKPPEGQKGGHIGPKSPIQRGKKEAPSKNIPGGTGLSAGGVSVPGAVVRGADVALPSARIVIALLAAGWLDESPERVHTTGGTEQPETPGVQSLELVYEPDAEPMPDYDNEPQDDAGYA